MKSFAIPILIIFLFGCGSPVETQWEFEQNLVLDIEKRAAIYEDGIEIVPVRLFILGNLVSAVPNDLQYLSINSDTLSGTECSGYTRAGQEIRNWYHWNNETSMGSSDSLYVSVSSEIGLLEGNVEFPSRPDQIQISGLDSIERGATISLSWVGDECDFYMIQTNYKWKSNERSMYYDFLFHYSEETTFTYPDSTFRYNGEIHSIKITPVNGPRPSLEMEPNMTGAGEGFLYYSGFSISTSAGIIVGGGYNTQLGQSSMVSPSDSNCMSESKVFNGSEQQRSLLDHLTREVD